MEYSTRAKALLTKNAQKRLEGDAERARTAKNGLTAEQYWKTKVHCETDAATYYELYYPQLTKELALALAKRMTDLAKSDRVTLAGKYLRDVKPGSNVELDAEDDKWWDFKKELADLKLRAHVNRFEERLLEEQKEEEKLPQ